MMKNIVVLGGGTAGWLTALLTREFYLDANITVVESDEIGILGAGEGTVPHFINILDLLGIPFSDLVKECGATVKQGIRFTNWDGDGTDYFHSFSATHGLGFRTLDLNDSAFENIAVIKQLANVQPINNINFPGLLSAQGRVPFTHDNRIDSQFSNPINQFQSHGTFAAHFNARALAKFLRGVAEFRGIKRVEGKLVKVISDDKENITQLTLDNGKTISVDFAFDCSGFARLLVGKHYNTEWINYKRHLPLDTALPFFIPHDNTNIRPETESIAMKYGWVWKIPVKDRYGCGYVFDSKYINEAEALAEVEEYFGMKLDSPKTFKFNAGSFSNTLVKNCMAVGLAQSFVEPLEATSIWVSCLNLLQFLKGDGIHNPSTRFRKTFNQDCIKRNEEVVSFLYLHYLTQRNDSEFWREFRTNTEMVEQTKDSLDVWKCSVPTEYSNGVNQNIFLTDSWMQVADGLHLLKPEAFQKRVHSLGIDQRIGNRFIALVKNMNQMVSSCVPHDEFLNYLRQQ
jgi:tryptophan halogenase